MCCICRSHWWYVWQCYHRRLEHWTYICNAVGELLYIWGQTLHSVRVLLRSIQSNLSASCFLTFISSWAIERNYCESRGSFCFNFSCLWLSFALIRALVSLLDFIYYHIVTRPTLCWWACTKTRNNETKRPKRNHRNDRNETTKMTKMKTNTTNMIRNDRNKTTCERKTELFYM